MKKRAWIIYCLGIFVAGFLLYSLILNKYFVVFRVDQHSMENTLYNGDKVLVKLSKEVSRNDIVVFRHHTTTFIKRCIALSGDTLSLINGGVWINGQLVKISTSREEKRKNHEKDAMILDCFGINWTMSDFGPVIIPKKGLSIKITPKNESIYNMIIQNESSGQTGHQKLNRDSIYTFKRDYFFALGDNKMHSDDSRIFGFIPVDQIIGKTDFVLFSKLDLSRICRSVK